MLSLPSSASQAFLSTALTECLFVNSQACNAVCLKVVGILMSDVSDFVEINVVYATLTWYHA